MEYIINSTSGSWADIARSNTYWAAERIPGNVGGGLSLDLMLQAQQIMRENANGKLSLVLCGTKQWRTYGNLMAPDRRWVKDIRKLDGGFDALDFNGVPVVADFDCDDGQMYFFDESTFQILEEEPLNFMDKDGSVLSRVKDEDAYEATLVWRGNLACNNPHANAVIYDLA